MLIYGLRDPHTKEIRYVGKQIAKCGLTFCLVTGDQQPPNITYTDSRNYLIIRNDGVKFKTIRAAIIESNVAKNAVHNVLNGYTKIARNKKTKEEYSFTRERIRG